VSISLGAWRFGGEDLNAATESLVPI